MNLLERKSFFCIKVSLDLLVNIYPFENLTCIHVKIYKYIIILQNIVFQMRKTAISNNNSNNTDDIYMTFLP